MDFFFWVDAMKEEPEVLSEELLERAKAGESKAQTEVIVFMPCPPFLGLRMCSVSDLFATCQFKVWCWKSNRIGL